MKINHAFILIFILLNIRSNAQSQVIINPLIHLPKDSIESKTLISDLNNFLSLAQQRNEENKFVLPEKKTETFLFLNEIKDIQKSKQNNKEFFFKPYLTNVARLSETQYLIQISYIGTSDSNAILRASFNLLADKVNNSFLFQSPLYQNTKHWKTLRLDNTIFHYKDSINQKKIQSYKKLVSSFDKKLNLKSITTEFYCCENLMEAEKIIGVDYKADYNGRTSGVRDVHFDKKEIIVLGNNNADFNHFDEHDLWHDRLSLVVDRSKVNKPVDEGCAYLYGGSWGLSWGKIWKEFKLQVTNNRDVDWAAIKETPIYFKTNNYNNSVDYIVNALLVKKIEREKGFSGIWELLNIGPVEKGNEKYYQTLEKLTGITKSNYNKEVWKLIDSEK